MKQKDSKKVLKEKMDDEKLVPLKKEEMQNLCGGEAQWKWVNGQWVLIN
ncbi:MAG: hypothetical protein LBN11_05970 [Tannerella sp.]|jgi:hypothetical protein|nr:hypothetical protein [Tannerella sp.]